MTGRRWLAAVSMLVVFAVPATARQGRSAGGGGHGGSSTGRQAVTRGADGGGCPGCRRRAEPVRPLRP